jgi:hypothetical protein
MQIRGHLRDGIVVLDRDPGLPNGTEVSVLIAPLVCEKGDKAAQALVFPLVLGTKPNSVELTNERIAEILDEEDASS